MSKRPLVLAAAVLVAACARNPVTGKKQLSAVRRQNLAVYRKLRSAVAPLLESISGSP